MSFAFSHSEDRIWVIEGDPTVERVTLDLAAFIEADALRGAFVPSGAVLALIGDEESGVDEAYEREQERRRALGLAVDPDYGSRAVHVGPYIPGGDQRAVGLLHSSVLTRSVVTGEYLDRATGLAITSGVTVNEALLPFSLSNATACYLDDQARRDLRSIDFGGGSTLGFPLLTTASKPGV